MIDSDSSINLGSVYETVVAQELIAHGYTLRYYDNKVKGEVDFLVDDYDTLSAVPIEVKSGRDFRRHRALDKFIANEDYNIKNAILFSNDRDVVRYEKMVYMPVYYVMFLKPSSPVELRLSNFILHSSFSILHSRFDKLSDQFLIKKILSFYLLFKKLNYTFVTLTVL